MRVYLKNERRTLKAEADTIHEALEKIVGDFNGEKAHIRIETGNNPAYETSLTRETIKRLQISSERRFFEKRVVL